ncbi:MAG: hypothetical protein JWO02_3701, partial [Solirubrobacterales bacterium]|nr:hypothetical protein [Solirubrobacterales bacterium]
MRAALLIAVVGGGLMGPVAGAARAGTIEVSEPGDTFGGPAVPAAAANCSYSTSSVPGTQRGPCRLRDAIALAHDGDRILMRQFGPDPFLNAPLTVDKAVDIDFAGQRLNVYPGITITFAAVASIRNGQLQVSTNGFRPGLESDPAPAPAPLIVSGSEDDADSFGYPTLIDLLIVPDQQHPEQPAVDLVAGGRGGNLTRVTFGGTGPDSTIGVRDATGAGSVDLENVIFKRTSLQLRGLAVVRGRGQLTFKDELVEGAGCDFGSDNTLIFDEGLIVGGNPPLNDVTGTCRDEYHSPPLAPPTTAALEASPSPAAADAQLTFKATVAAQDRAGGTPSGDVEIYDPKASLAPLATATLSDAGDGTATTTLTYTRQGVSADREYRVRYLGVAGTWRRSVGGATVLGAPAPDLDIAVLGPFTLGARTDDGIRVHASAPADSGLPVPTGNLVLTLDDYTGDQYPLDENGDATLPVRPRSLDGNAKIEYQGDATYPATIAQRTLEVAGAITPDVALDLSDADGKAPGDAAVAHVTVTAPADFPGDLDHDQPRGFVYVYDDATDRPLGRAEAVDGSTIDVPFALYAGTRAYSARFLAERAPGRVFGAGNSAPQHATADPARATATTVSASLAAIRLGGGPVTFTVDVRWADDPTRAPETGTVVLTRDGAEIGRGTLGVDAPRDSDDLPLPAVPTGHAEIAVDDLAAGDAPVVAHFSAGGWQDSEGQTALRVGLVPTEVTAVHLKTGTPTPVSALDVIDVEATVRTADSDPASLAGNVEIRDGSGGPLVGNPSTSNDPQTGTSRTFRVRLPARTAAGRATLTP